MVVSGSLMKSVLLAILLVGLAESGSAAEKLSSCCKVVSTNEITEPILGFMFQTANPPCVRAVIFQTASGLYCSLPRAPWVRPKITAFRKAQLQSTASPVTSTSPVSLLSIITSTASPSSSSPSPSSPSSTTPSSTSSPSSSFPSPSPSSPSSPSPSSTSQRSVSETTSGRNNQ